MKRSSLRAALLLSIAVVAGIRLAWRDSASPDGGSDIDELQPTPEVADRPANDRAVPQPGVQQGPTQDEEDREKLRRLPTPPSYFAFTERIPRQENNRDEDDAARFARMLASAERGDVDAQFNLGLLYDQGQEVTEEAGESVRLPR